MSEFLNTIDVLGDNAVTDGIITRAIAEFKDDTITKVRLRGFYRCTQLKSLALPVCETLGYEAFRGCSSLKDISLPACTFVDYSGFGSCSSIEELILPEVTRASNNAFSGCSSLKRVSMPKIVDAGQELFARSFVVGSELCLPSVTTTGMRTFMSSGLRIIDLPVCAVIGGNSFYQSMHLEAVILRKTETICLLNNAYPGEAISSGQCYIYVPRNLLDSYKVATNWSAFADQFRALEDYTVDGTIMGALDESKI